MNLLQRSQRLAEVARHLCFAGGERCSQPSQVSLNSLCERVRVTKNAPGSAFGILERCHGLAEIVERGAVVFIEHRRVMQPHFERGVITLTENASRDGYCFAQK